MTEMFNLKLFITELADKIIKNIKYDCQVCRSHIVINKNNNNV